MTSASDSTGATGTGHPQPSAPVADSFTALTGYLDQLLTAAKVPGDGATAGLAEGLHAAALENLRAIAAACDVDWEDVLAERDRRSVVAE